ncbi:F-box domain containing protein [Pandoravirus neocaledonia]|uniref:F-box domain containing protein n=1 Tax=Pandoravirus neocaledonia TaxID=2107708 RepID=A0A2U7UCQ8_9VIRU|nr:F-box domain containing protein [Pandoravirus neocaledonia]AVK76120.1 F-box domain containing protein [Pandoravirus neocaledonia]
MAERARRHWKPMAAHRDDTHRGGAAATTNNKTNSLRTRGPCTLPGMNTLPNELVAAVLGFLGPDALCACSLVSWPWRHTSRRLLGFERPEPADALGSAIDGLPRMQTLLSRAAYRNRADIIAWARAKGYPWDDEACPAAAYGGHAALLRHLHDTTHCPRSLDDCLVAAAAGGHVTLVQSLIADIEADRFRPTEARNKRLVWWERLPVRNVSEACARASVAAAATGQVDVVRALQERHALHWTNQTDADVWSTNVMGNQMTALAAHLDDTASLIAAERGDLLFLCRLWSRLDKQHKRAALFIAALHGHDDLVRWVQSAQSRQLCDTAETSLVEWVLLLDRNAVDKTPDAAAAPLALAAMSSMSRDLAVAAAYAGHLGVLAGLKAHGVCIKRICTLAAAYNGHTHVLAWARDQGVRFSGLVTSVAAARGHGECAQFCERECGVRLVWEYNEPTWRRSCRLPFGNFIFGQRRHVADMASSYGCAASAVRLAQRCTEAPTPRVFKRLWLAGDRRVILPLVGQARGSTAT